MKSSNPTIPQLTRRLTVGEREKLVKSSTFKVPVHVYALKLRYLSYGPLEER